MAEIQGYHIFAIPGAIKDYDEGISYTKLRNPLSDGFRSSILFGSENGVRRFTLGMPTLTGTLMDGRTVTGIYGETQSYEAYLWSLYRYNQVTGNPFAFQSIRNDQYYLVDFANEDLTYKRFLTKLYSTGVELTQVRVTGVSVFDFTQVPVLYAAYDDETYYTGAPFPGWADLNGATGDDRFLVTSGDVAVVTAGLNGRDYLRLSNSTNDGVMAHSDPLLLKEAWMVIKLRESTFSNNGGVLTQNASTSAGILVGDTGTTKFFNFGIGGDLKYELNGVEYAQSNMQAPMNEWGVVHVRQETGSIPMDGIQIGHDRAEANRYAELDVAMAIFSEELIPKDYGGEIYEALITRFDL
jgi:hypothetical protein